MDERLRQQQFSLARHLRDPLGNAPPPDIEERRLRVYRELFYNAIEGLLASGFPRLRGLLGEQQWHGLVREFYREERSHTPCSPVSPGSSSTTCGSGASIGRRGKPSWPTSNGAKRALPGRARRSAVSA